MTVAVLVACTVFVLGALHPSKLLLNTTPAGGDMGAHVWAPWFLRHHLLPHGRISGWAPAWYDGFPALTFYFPGPYLVIALLSYVIPYGIAFKLVSVSGLVGLPLCAYAFGRLTNMRFPGPQLLAIATVPYLFDRYFTIWGGNIASALAGEFSFSISLCCALLFLGVFAKSLETGRYKWLAALLLAATLLAHLLPTLFAVVGAILIWLLQPSRRRLGIGIIVGVVGLAIAGFWLIPFAMRLGYSNDMGWERSPYFMKGLFPWMCNATKADANVNCPTFSSVHVYTNHLKLVAALAAAGALGGILLRRRTTLLITGLGVAFAAAFRFLPQGAIWNERMLPFWYLCLYLAAAAALAEAAIAVGVLLAREARPTLDTAADLEPVPVSVGPPGPADPFVPPTAGSPAAASEHLFSDRADAAVPVGGADHVPAGGGPPLAAGGDDSSVGAGVGSSGDGGGSSGAGRAGAFGDGDSGGGSPVAQWAEASTTSGRDDQSAWLPAVIAPVLVALIVLTFVGQAVPDWSWFFARLPGHALLGGSAQVHNPNFVSSWANWNYSGYQQKAAYPEYKDVIDTMAAIGKSDGCGRAMWEYEPEEDRFGTPMALMLLPMWTNGCIDSQEGLFFESSATVPYHFLNQSELSANPSRAMRDLPYRSFDIYDGIAHLQLLGVRYYMAISPTAIAAAMSLTQGPNATLKLVGHTAPHQVSYSSGATPGLQTRTWQVFEVADSSPVTGLAYQPVVMTGVPTKAKGWQHIAVDWYQNRGRWDVPLAASGPSNWARVKGASQDPPRTPVHQAQVSNLVMTDDRISFDVDQPGTPVLVKTSYFPNWQATGADGPWRVTPNEMVVVPTSTHVELHYGYTPVDNAGRLATAGGLLVAFWWWRRERRNGTHTGPDLPAPDDLAAGDTVAVAPHVMVAQGAPEDW